LSTHSSRENHWNKIYNTKDTTKVSWFQENPSIALELLGKFDIAKTSKIIDVGGGDSRLIDKLIELDYQDVTVLDISRSAINKSRIRLGDDAKKVEWLVVDAAKFKPSTKYDFWYDRAAFHFLTDDDEIDYYINNLNNNITKGGMLILATFSIEGPDQCSGLNIKQYSEKSLNEKLKKHFTKEECFYHDHITPSGGKQNFIYCCFRKK